MHSNIFEADDLKNQKIYAKLFAENGRSFKTLNWGSVESQLLRFKVLSEIANLNNQSILDVGCGLADYYQYLIDHQISADYCGLDITHPLIDEAREKFKGVKFLNSSLTDIDDELMFDYVFASGIYTYRTKNENEFLQLMTQNMFNHCRKGVAFNSLSTWTSAKDDGEFYADPLETLKFCKTLSPWVVMRHDYHARDFTIYIYKERNL
ncbi:MAG: class I SAM-dependent methyltransferase [Ginsengibacter sp.]